MSKYIYAALAIALFILSIIVAIEGVAILGGHSDKRLPLPFPWMFIWGILLVAFTFRQYRRGKNKK